MCGKTFGKEHLSEKIRQIRKNENFSDESFYDEMKKNLEGKKWKINIQRKFIIRL